MSDLLALSPLGKSLHYTSHYSPQLLFPIARMAKREEIGLDTNIPLYGWDVWNAYELSWLTLRGKPVVARAQFQIPADSPSIIESKSLKLYLNSFNQTVFNDAVEVNQRLIQDLSLACGANIKLTLMPLGAHAERHIQTLNGELIDNLDVVIERYTPAPEYLTSDASNELEETLFSQLLKSNCLVTGQPDWGSVAVRYKGPKIEVAGLLKYIVSFRDHNEFHEQCVERIYYDIWQRCKPRRLEVWARYTRRGGLDINPFRASEKTALPANDGDVRQ